jgi:outer membrane protein TolC
MVHQAEADRTAYGIVAQKQREALGREEDFTIEAPEQSLRARLLKDQALPQAISPTPSQIVIGEEGEQAPVQLGLLEALQVGAKNNRDYQERKEDLFRSALALDLERDEFRHSFSGLLSTLFSTDASDSSTVSGIQGAADGGVTRKLKSGAELTGLIAVDLVKLLTQGGASALGLLADASISIPLLRGAGSDIVSEPLTQAERNVIYAIYDFERYKRIYAVRVASDYLGVLSDQQQVRNSEENYRGLIAATRRARRLADTGRLPEFQFDQAIQDELRSRSRWVQARQSYLGNLDSFKVLIGLPADAAVELDAGELKRLEGLATTLSQVADSERYAGNVPSADAEIVLREPDRTGGGPLEMAPAKAVRLALASRLDLRQTLGEVADARRKVKVAADALRAELTLLGSASLGEGRSISSATSDDASLDPGKGAYSALLSLDLPIERTAERIAYRNSLIAQQRAVRAVEELEDGIKLAVRNKLRDLLEAREGLQIQAQAVRLAEKRVKSTNLFLQAGRAVIRDLLESQEALLSAQNSMTSAVVNYRIAELELQRDLGVLEVDEQGLWQEYSVPAGTH